MSNLNFNKNKKSNFIAISVGDPAGIGIEITLKSLNRLKDDTDIKPILVGCKKCILGIHSDLKKKGIKDMVNPKDIKIIDIPFKGVLIQGKPNSYTGEASYQWLTHATNLVIKGNAKSLVTAPIAKHAWHQAGHFYAGQTERLAELCKAKEVSMMFTALSPNNGWRLNTLLATTHIPLAEVTKKLEPQIILSKLDALLAFCKQFKEEPKLAIAGINPHSGEKGHLGNEETQWLIPTIKKWKNANPNIQLDGPIPPDTCWIPAANAWNESKQSYVHDGFLALYHDQGLIPLKLIAFDSAVNTTLGLPFARTSPDHGTGFDIAGKGVARPTSMTEAIKTASDLSRQENL